MDDIRLDKYLWAVRVFKTRSDAADAVRNNKVTVNGAYAKPSREVKIGDVIAVRRMQVTYSYKVLDLVSSRQPAKNVSLYCLNVTPQEELDKLNVPRETVFVFRDRGTGRPHQEGAPRAGRPDGRTLLRRGVGAHPAAGPRHAGNGYPPPKTPPEGGRPAIPPTARRSAPGNHAAFAVSTPHGAISTAKLPKTTRFLRNTQKRKTGPFRASTKARFPVSICRQASILVFGYFLLKKFIVRSTPIVANDRIASQKTLSRSGIALRSSSLHSPST